jgi:hypothetical protein
LLYSKYIKAAPAPIIHYSGVQRHFPKEFVTVLKKHQYRVKPDRLSGDAPKDFIYVYEHGKCRKLNTKKWIPYIAKVGHKWFPSESVTEHLLTRLGQEWGFNIANSKLYVFAGQLRFCSKFFRKPEQELVHGADILARHLEETDTGIIEQIDRKGWSQELLSLKFVRQAITDVFPDEATIIIEGLHKMLLFDAIVGNNDRHFFNWGVLRHLKGEHKPYFSPIYDTARGLFWNYSDEKVLSLYSDEKQLSNRIVKYCNDTKPKIGWDGEKEINHFQLVERLLVNNDCTFDLAQKLFSNDNLNKAIIILNTEFKGMISDTRKSLIIRYLEYRFEAFNKLLNS